MFTLFDNNLSSVVLLKSPFNYNIKQLLHFFTTIQKYKFSFCLKRFFKRFQVAIIFYFMFVGNCVRCSNVH